MLVVLLPDAHHNDERIQVLIIPQEPELLVRLDGAEGAVPRYRFEFCIIWWEFPGFNERFAYSYQFAFGRCIHVWTAACPGRKRFSFRTPKNDAATIAFEYGFFWHLFIFTLTVDVFVSTVLVGLSTYILTVFQRRRIALTSQMSDLPKSSRQTRATIVTIFPYRVSCRNPGQRCYLIFYPPLPVFFTELRSFLMAYPCLHR